MRIPTVFNIIVNLLALDDSLRGEINHSKNMNNESEGILHNRHLKTYGHVFT